MKKAGWNQPFRRRFTSHLLENGDNIRTIQELLAHKSLQTTMVYIHVINKGSLGLKGPADNL